MAFRRFTDASEALIKATSVLVSFECPGRLSSRFLEDTQVDFEVLSSINGVSFISQSLELRNALQPDHVLSFVRMHSRIPLLRIGQEAVVID